LIQISARQEKNIGVAQAAESMRFLSAKAALAAIPL
jgi:hypothetical protein